MTDEFYSVEKVAELLGLHVRTVRAYIGEGRLNAVRIGKQYRIARSHLDALMASKLLGSSVPRQRNVEVSSVVQIDAIDASQANRLTNTLIASCNGPQSEPGKQIQCQYNESNGRLKVIITGSVDTTAGLLKLINLLLEQG